MTPSVMGQHHRPMEPYNPWVAVGRAGELYQTEPTARLERFLAEHTGQMHRRLERTHGVSRAPLQGAIGTMRVLAACAAIDRGDHAAAATLAGMAHQIAVEAGDADTQAWAAETQCYSLGARRNHVALGQAAEATIREYGGKVGDRAGIAQLNLHLAQAHAAHGRRGDAYDALYRAYGLADTRPPENPLHHLTMDPQKWAFYAMTVFGRLHDHAALLGAAEAVIDGAVVDGRIVRPFRVAAAQLWLGVAAAERGDLDEAASLGLAALRLPRLVAANVQLARELAAAIQLRQRSYPGAALFLRELVSAREALTA